MAGEEESVGGEVESIGVAEARTALGWWLDAGTGLIMVGEDQIDQVRVGGRWHAGAVGVGRQMAVSHGRTLASARVDAQQSMLGLTTS